MELLKYSTYALQIFTISCTDLNYISSDFGLQKGYESQKAFLQQLIQVPIWMQTKVLRHFSP